MGFADDVITMPEGSYLQIPHATARVIPPQWSKPLHRPLLFPLPWCSTLAIPHSGEERIDPATCDHRGPTSGRISGRVLS